MPALPKTLRLGTCAWTAKGWVGSFYPSGTKPAQFLAEYSKHFNCVEVDSTFYGVPKIETVHTWRESVPHDFRFAAKFPKAVTHDKELVDCESDCAAFVEAMTALGDKQGPLLLQFPYYKQAARPDLGDFVSRLGAVLGFLRANTEGLRLAVEVRNKTWLKPQLFDCLREHGAAFTIIHHPWMYPFDHYMSPDEFLTADFSYIRLMGDRYGIERQTKTWDTSIVDRLDELEQLIPIMRAILGNRAIRELWGLVNNHFSGHAPADVRKIIELYTAE